MTGQFPAHHSIHGHIAAPELNAKRGMPNFLDTRVVTVARLLKEAGYATGHFGKWHLGNGPGAPLPDAYGFDEFCTSVSNDLCWSEAQKKDPVRFWSQSTPLVVDETLRFVEKNRRGPFYANVWTMLPHAPLDPTEEQMAPYAKLPGVRGYRTARQVYAASVTHLDAELGRLFRRLEEVGVARNTIVIFSSDNGPEDIHIANAGHSAYGTPGPFRGRKRSLYEGGIRVPLLVRWPERLATGRVDSTSVLTAVDFLPTVCTASGTAPPKEWRLDGEECIGTWEGRPSTRRKPVYWEWRFSIAGYHVNRSPMLAIREGAWKLLMNPDRSRVELYDIPKDPMELRNQAPMQAKVVSAMSEKLLAWQRTLPEGPRDPDAGRDDYPWPR
jgi:N-acetylgalactosamine-6-sulfatase